MAEGSADATQAWQITINFVLGSSLEQVDFFSECLITYKPAPTMNPITRMSLTCPSALAKRVFRNGGNIETNDRGAIVFSVRT
jgi:hypothetical protein